MEKRSRETNVVVNVSRKCSANTVTGFPALMILSASRVVTGLPSRPPDGYIVPTQPFCANINPVPSVKKSAKRGRPPVSDESRSEALHRVRVTPTEHARYQEAAAASGLSWSDWVRAALDAYCKRKPRK